jgi:quercetin dioxygenase-like cupin family protein
MKTVKDAAGTPYEAPKHHGVYGIQKFVEESERVKVMYSYFQPNGGAEMSGSPTEKIYYIVKGSITVNGKDESHVLNQGDLIFIGANEEREMIINDGKPAEVLVFIITP